MQKISIHLTKVLADIDYAYSKEVFLLVSRWVSIVGDHIGNFTCPMRIKSLSPQKKILMIDVSNNSINTELHYLKDEIMERVNLYLGSSFVSDVKFNLRPNSRPIDNSSTTESNYSIDLERKFSTLLESIK